MNEIKNIKNINIFNMRENKYALVEISQIYTWFKIHIFKCKYSNLKNKYINLKKNKKKFKN